MPEIRLLKIDVRQLRRGVFQEVGHRFVFGERQQLSGCPVMRVVRMPLEKPCQANPGTIVRSVFQTQRIKICLFQQSLKSFDGLDLSTSCGMFACYPICLAIVTSCLA